ncbi:hypothetical protein GTW78_08625 [Streptomyces sp. SID4948]|nr:MULTISPECIES: hypothetical protein [unclassified Streptomyces]MYS20293.1 hypothetical protein [Streptomyces sp. SID4948]
MTDYELLSVHVDERRSSVTLGFFALALPAGAVAAWEARGHNAVEFFLICVGVKSFSLDGWNIDRFDRVSLAGSHVELSGEGKRMSFDVDEIRADGPTGRLAGRAI